MLNVLVTGSNGFIGKNLLKKLNNLENINILKFNRNDTEIYLEECIAKSDFIIHLAGEVRPNSSKDEFKNSNVLLTDLILKIIKKQNKKVPILLTSSIHAKLLKNEYGKTKRESELLIENYSKEFNINCFIYRLPHLFGEECKPNYNSVISTWIYNSINDLEINCFDRSIEMQYVYVQDIVYEFLSVLELKETSEIYVEPEKIYKTTLGEILDFIDEFKVNVLNDKYKIVNNEFKKKLFQTYQNYLNRINILVTGSNGQLGSEIRELSSNYSYNFFFTDRTNIDITDKKNIKSFCQTNNINAIINCAGYTAVDKAESDEINADLVNRKAVKKLALVCQELNIKLIHISTDYVFDGKNFKPYCEEYRTSPQSIYGKSKLDGENEMIKINSKNSIIIRTSWLYSTFGNNFVKTMLRLGGEKESLGVIFDQVGTPTYARDLAKTVLDIIPQITNEKVEIYNYSNEGVLSWYDFAKEIMKMAKLDCKINPIETFQYPTPAKRPHFSVLNKSKIKLTFNIEIPFWKDSLAECLKIMGEIK